MKKLILPIFILLTFYLPASPVYADCRGCCSPHGGVLCADGITECHDGTFLSSKCQSKGCDKCDTVTGKSTSSKIKLPVQQEREISSSVRMPNTNASPGVFYCNGHVAYGIPGPEDQLLCREGYQL